MPQSLYKVYTPIRKDKECSIPLENGLSLVCESFGVNPGVSYVRFVNKDGYEVAYWESTEWTEDPECVMGAILGLANAEPEFINRDTA